MPNLENVNLTKEKILTTIQTRGPTYPAKISRELALNPIFAAAFLSELLAEKKLKTSNLKVGSSHLYFIPGQENLLEPFSQYLNSKEREAFELLKKQGILEDEMQEPAIRVALRKINDFAAQLNVRTNAESQEQKVFWKYYMLTDDQTKSLLESTLNPSPSPTPQVPQKKAKPLAIQTETETILQKESGKTTQTQTLLLEEKVKKSKSIKAKAKPSEFANKLKEILVAKDIEILESILEKPKDFVAKIRIDTIFGKQEYLMFGRDKKKVTEDDLAIALHKASAEKLPALIMSSGVLDDEAKAYLEHWKNLVKFEKIK